MAWEVEFTDEFGRWWDTLDSEEQEAINAVVSMLEERGPKLPFPYSSRITSARHRHMRELRVQCRGDPYRILYAFDPRRVAVLLIGGSKGGDDRWYGRFLPIADALYDDHLEEFRREGMNDGA